MKAVIFTKDDPPLQLHEVDLPKIGKGECLVKLKAAALNRRDYWITVGKYPGIKENVILGSDGCGVVEEGSELWQGKEVVINPNINWGDNPEFQGESYQILGMPVNGTLAEYIVVNENRLAPKPVKLSFEEAAALPLAGLTAYRAVFTKAKVTAGKSVLITGIGGGVSQFALSFCVALGAKVYVTSSDKRKISAAKSSGAKGGFNYKDVDWSKTALKDTKGFDVIIDSAGGASLKDYMKLIKPGGKLVFYGSTTGRPEDFDIFRLFWNQISVLGSSMGNDREFTEMVKFVEGNQIKPVIDQVFELDQVYEAFRRFISPDHRGKIVVKID
ncbi:MAG: zinc-binding alcohol dehydrogenase/oxidoreductase [Cyclobacteriaceae bacterium]|jgi:NADPH:quinone reductase-like Zn-dependent oxidoreductase